MIDLSALSFTNVLDLLGTFAFAVSGIRWASTKQFDWFGAYVIGLVTAIGGGTTRDLLLNVPPFWMQNASYLTVTGIALLATILFRNQLFRWGRALFLFDSIGLGLFTVVGVGKSLEAGLPFWVCIMMGAITGSVGGVIRDVLLNEVPLLFRKDIYALACIVGGIVYMFSYQYGLSISITEMLAALTVILIRVVAVRYHIQLPFLSPINTERNDRDKKE
ncbi:trimeric intracellular cation channel family protein [Pontibacter sp. HSC-14F20]|uniref:trimeric intracellular cation channel family protein n=1 Tax=Pontibacter sp. HSC-14F20 TaxID=2864136 RepID=UPI001C737BEC|nr:trimeric intracellular cation channel family protein [Pontibacter sp. HSC-14F20]MBX0335576.1 trimeric intracellular cation channel family protein [Pontibacter sp. HSC-14F20]